MASILIVDDDEGFRAPMADFLSACGHAVRTATNGLQAVQSYRSKPADLVLTDLLMPHNGLSVINVLCGHDPHVRIIAVSGGGSHRLDYAKVLGARQTLTKPFTLEQLEESIEAVLAGGS